MSDQIHLISILLYIIISVDIYLYIRAEILQRVWWLRLTLYSWNQAFLLRIQGAHEQYQIHSLQKSKVQELSYISCLLYVSENSPCCVVIGQKKNPILPCYFIEAGKNCFSNKDLLLALILPMSVRSVCHFKQLSAHKSIKIQQNVFLAQEH